MFKKRTPLWREAHFQVKSADGYRALLDVQMLFRVAGAGIVHLVKSEQVVRVLWHFQKRWQAKRHLNIQKWSEPLVFLTF